MIGEKVVILEVTQVAIESVVYSTVQDLFLLTRCLAHGSCSWPSQWTITKLCRIMSHGNNNIYKLLVVEYAHCTCKIETVSII